MDHVVDDVAQPEHPLEQMWQHHQNIHIAGFVNAVPEEEPADAMLQDHLHKQSHLDLKDDDFYHLPQALIPLLPESVSIIPQVIELIAQWSVSAQEETRRCAEIHAAQTINKALEMIRSMAEELESTEYTEDDNRVFSRFAATREALSKLQETRCQKVNAGDTFDAVQDRRAEAAQDAAQGLLVNEQLVEKVFQGSLHLSSIDWHNFCSTLNELLLEIIMFLCKATCYKPHEMQNFLNQVAVAYSPLSLDQTMRRQLLLCYTVKNLEKAIELPGPTVQESMDLLVEALRSCGYDGTVGQALLSTMLHALTGSGGPCSGYSLASTAIHAHTMVRNYAPHILALAHVNDLARHLRDTIVCSIVPASRDIYDKDEFLWRLSEAYAGPMDKELRAQLLLARHKMYGIGSAQPRVRVRRQ